MAEILGKQQLLLSSPVSCTAFGQSGQTEMPMAAVHGRGDMNAIYQL